MDKSAILGLSVLSVIMSVISIVLGDVNFDDDIKIKEMKEEQNKNNIEKIISYILRPLKKPTVHPRSNENNYNDAIFNIDDDDDFETVEFNSSSAIATDTARSVKRNMLLKLRKEIMIKYNKAKNGLYISILFSLVFAVCFLGKYDYISMIFTWVPTIAFLVIFLARDIIRFRFLLEEDLFGVLDTIGAPSATTTTSTSTSERRRALRFSFIKSIFNPNFAYSRVRNEVGGDENNDGNIDASKTFNNIFMLYVTVFVAVDIVYFILLQTFGISKYKFYGVKVNFILLQIVFVQMFFSILIHILDKRLNASSIIRTFIENFIFILMCTFPFILSHSNDDQFNLLIVFNCILLPALIHTVRLLYLIPYYKSSSSTDQNKLTALSSLATNKKTERIKTFISHEKNRHITVTKTKDEDENEISDIDVEPISYISYDITRNLFNTFLFIHSIDGEGPIELPIDVYNSVMSRFSDLRADFDDSKSLFVNINGKYYIDPKKTIQYDPLSPALTFLTKDAN